MDLEKVRLNEISQRKSSMCYHSNAESKKNGTKELNCKTEIESQMEKTNRVTKGKGGGVGRDKLGV